ncbi:hypothetical protein COW36_07385 [bacterium (Candidatus Blackallbacteria) CG17_big_fil_post_rev_8_21_14_2_50_48_46]|uniref:N-acetyltransferase domain-containing protein n=1 Tax=bacterium (Candidatus Blackallbacteria) CG17_big_fil_post_rev_8_21_14_2_50_48_46 TaxID=2014261 RepID=A0A2M7G746_9BACT|nr:MAG: hypothetical protein COW64_06895 [bacterium (Candidatus Blackallbacteria) CG18_big_fil_WC_8_21_14_2_50_49_26]PIW17882.1 MAG: hypothetical protein COW36_07385 [bacterium (Candidatus Blackallbacteria) CG17_big_fil_post_rev_8_21_14_2_50_48_46]PIW48558.1 MAG: hypothetical protein COW20_09340 [bacterium (Candidatus Blackallbacteria) CG13_big_fil_rev_8_21_14_2_50_49_14]
MLTLRAPLPEELETVVDWIFNVQGLERAFLNVSASNTPALSLYQRAGFELDKAGVALDWWRNSSRQTQTLGL